MPIFTAHGLPSGLGGGAAEEMLSDDEDAERFQQILHKEHLKICAPSFVDPDRPPVSSMLSDPSKIVKTHAFVCQSNMEYVVKTLQKLNVLGLEDLFVPFSYTCWHDRSESVYFLQVVMDRGQPVGVQDAAEFGTFLKQAVSRLLAVDYILVDIRRDNAVFCDGKIRFIDFVSTLHKAEAIKHPESPTGYLHISNEVNESYHTLMVTLLENDEFKPLEHRVTTFHMCFAALEAVVNMGPMSLKGVAETFVSSLHKCHTFEESANVCIAAFKSTMDRIVSRKRSSGDE